MGGVLHNPRSGSCKLGQTSCFTVANESFLFPSQNQKLHIENRLLQEKTNGLLAENEELRQRLSLDTIDSKEEVGAAQSATQVGRPSERRAEMSCSRSRFSVCCPRGRKQVWGSGLLSPQHSGYVCLRSRCRPSSS